MRRINRPKQIRRCRKANGNADTGKVVGQAEHLEQHLPQEEYDVSFAPSISQEQREYVLEHFEAYCRMCGTAPGDIDDLTGCSARFYVDLNADMSISSNDAGSSNIRMLCSTCYEGAKQIAMVKPPVIWLLSQVRRAGHGEQRAVLDWLLKKFKE